MGRRPIVAVLAAGGLILFFTLGIRQGLGLFLGPMSTDLGWGREVFSLAIAIQNMFWGLCQPFAGMAADRYGARPVLIVGSVCYALGLATMSVTEAPWMLYLGGGVLVGFALSAVSFAIVLGAVGRMVSERRRSLALGVASMGGSVGQFCMVPVMQSLLTGMGWNSALLVLAAGPCLMVPLALAFAAKGDQAGGLSEDASGQSMGEAIKEASGHGGYWYLIAGFFVCGFHVTFIMTHLPAYITDSGLAPWVAAAALTMIGGFNIAGTLICGVLGGRFRKKYVLSSLYFLRAVAILLFILSPVTEFSVMAFAGAMGLLWLGTVPLTSGLVAEIFGVRYMSTLFGIVFFSHQVGAFLGVWLGGLFYDLAGSYQTVWVLAILLGLLATVLHWPIADRPVPRLARA